MFVQRESSDRFPLLPILSPRPQEGKGEGEGSKAIRAVVLNFSRKEKEQAGSDPVIETVGRNLS